MHHNVQVLTWQKARSGVGIFSEAFGRNSNHGNDIRVLMPRPRIKPEPTWGALILPLPLFPPVSSPKPASRAPKPFHSLLFNSIHSFSALHPWHWTLIPSNVQAYPPLTPPFLPRRLDLGRYCRRMERPVHLPVSNATCTLLSLPRVSSFGSSE